MKWVKNFQFQMLLWKALGENHPNGELDERQKAYIIDSWEHVKLEGRHG